MHKGTFLCTTYLTPCPTTFLISHMSSKNYSRSKDTKNPAVNAIASCKSIYKLTEIHFKRREEMCFSPPTRKLF